MAVKHSIPRGTAVEIVTDIQAANRLQTTVKDIHTLIENSQLSGYFASWGARVQIKGPRGLEAWETELGLKIKN